ncbi:B-cell receptor CD22-like isoform X4 [Boleophthalmus pectinirostris]|uniref:B-cell receptor CD22-like isoform X4 n=1 Tax=Boleophthalmus pectinirostris TaxID=150288 RepID=UPI00242C1F2A|nr:B-cell receptor CD22-like isoform X4 [Boleophthalmus pectinirostris]
MMPQQISCLVLLMMVKAVTCYSVSYAEIETTSLNALVGTCVEIRCKVTGVLPDEDALWFWMKDGKRNGSKIGYTGTIVYSNKPRELPISPQFRGRVTYTGSTRLQNTASSSNNPSCSVRICDLTEQDRGVYFFRYSLKKRNFKWTTNNAVISVTDPCPITFNKPEPVQESQTITLTCSTPSSCSENLEIQTVPPSGLRTSQYGYSYSATASYRASWTDDGKEFTCQTRGNKNPQLMKKISISVEYKPKNINIEIVGQSREVAVGHSVTLKCNSDANPPPHTYYWYKGSQYLQRTTENRLELKKVQRADEGCYICKAANKHGSGYSTDLCIQVLSPPTSLTLSMDSEVTEGQNVSITCRVDSSPVSTLTLSRTSQGSPVELLRDTEHNSLIYSVTVTSAHSGEYTCSSHNSVGSDSTKRSLTVKYAPQKVRVQADPGLMVKENTTLTLHCSALSHPPVSSVTWSRGPTGQESLVHTGPTFSVSSVSVNDSGLYSCTAHNQVGQGTSPPAEVQVMFGPNQAVVLRAEEEQGPDGSSSVTLSCNSHSFPPVNLYTWYRRTEDGELKVSENINYTVLSTQPGVYYCTAKNQISESTSEPVSLFLQESFVKYIGLALVPLLIILCAFIVYRLKIKRSVEGVRTNKPWWRSCSKALGRWHSSRGCSEDVHAETPGRRDVPPPQQRADVMNSTSSANALYSTVNLPKHKQSRPGTSDENIASFFYASVHFDKNPSTLIPKEREEVVYSTVKKHHEEAGDVYENVRKKVDCSAAADSSEDEVDVSYSKVNLRSRVTAAEEEYSELNF